MGGVGAQAAVERCSISLGGRVAGTVSRLYDILGRHRVGVFACVAGLGRANLAAICNSRRWRAGLLPAAAAAGARRAKRCQLRLGLHAAAGSQIG